jgi:serine/threonine protein kinase
MLIILCSLEEDNLSHRDIKPENILYDHGRWRLCDFDDALYIDQRTIE